MKVIADYAMRGRPQAMSLSVISAALPLLFWLSASVVSLVILRRGQKEGVMLLLWALLPTVIWLVAGNDPRPITTVMGTVILAFVLRATVSWAYTLASAMVIGALSGWIFEITLPGIVADLVRLTMSVLEETGPALMGGLGDEIAGDPGKMAQYSLWAERWWVGILGAWQLTLMLCCLVLARWWQSVLYNPGGFRSEFHQLRLPAGMALGLVGAMVIFVLTANPWLAGWIPVLSVPLLIAGIALIHWSVSHVKLGTNWLVVFYLMLLLFLQFIYPLLIMMAVVDSCWDFRRRTGSGGAV